MKQVRKKATHRSQIVCMISRTKRAAQQRFCYARAAIDSNLSRPSFLIDINENIQWCSLVQRRQFLTPLLLSLFGLHLLPLSRAGKSKSENENNRHALNQSCKHIKQNAKKHKHVKAKSR